MNNAKIVGQIYPRDCYRRGIITAESYYELLVGEEADCIIRCELIHNPYYFYYLHEEDDTLFDELEEIEVSLSQFDKDIRDKIHQLMPC
ncbi:MAG: hypothetical protein WAV16_04480 [Candidatus Moraniibacteriota bacterium]